MTEQRLHRHARQCLCASVGRASRRKTRPPPAERRKSPQISTGSAVGRLQGRRQRNTLVHYKSGKKKPARGGLHSVGWWRWRESNSRPEDLYSRDYMLSLVYWISSPRRRRTGCGMTSHLALALRPSDPGGRDRSKCPRRDLRYYPRITRAERRPVRGPAGLSR